MENKVDISNKRVFVLVNTLQSVNSNVYANHCHFFTYSAKNIPGIKFEFWTPERMAIDTARNTAAQMAMEMNCDYLMFIDDDVMVPPDTLEKLLLADKDIIAGLVIIRGYPFNNMAFKYKENTIKDGKEVRNLDFFNDLEKEYVYNDEWYQKEDNR
jgi:glycosyltransferase involved in cell wall biosynthesis